MNPQEGIVVGSKFRLERPLARGGMGEVWAARHLELDVPVAVKFMEVKDEALMNARVRFEREAKAAAQLRSPHVVQVLDYGVHEGRQYMVMELLQGEDLRARLDREGRLSLDEVATIVSQLARGLKLAHDAGIIHRDIKPSNVFMAKVGDDEIVKMLDFGVAKDIALESDGTTTTSGQMLGSPAYMSPEQARGGRFDHRADLWSLAMMAYVALTGRHPFAGENLGDMLVNICTGELRAASDQIDGLPCSVDGFFTRALSRSPDGRFSNAREMADALLVVAAGASVSPSQPGTVDEETVDIHTVTRSEPEAREARKAPAGAEHVATGASVSLSARPPPRSRRRGWLYAVGGALVVAIVWLAARAVYRGDVRPVTAINPVPAVSMMEGRVGPDTKPSADKEPLGAAPAEPSASASSAVGTGASAGAVLPVRPLVPWPVRPRAQPAPRPRQGSTPVDPKFGLPTGSSR